MPNPYESPTSESSTRHTPKPPDKTHHLGRTLAKLTFVEIILAMLFAPGDGGRWQGYAIGAIVLVNGMIYLTQYVPFRFRHGHAPGTTPLTIVAYVVLAFASIVAMTFILGSGVLP